MDNDLNLLEEQILIRRLARAHEQGWGIACGLLCGAALFAVTALLLLRGGEQVGVHLDLLRIFFPGFSVTWFGSAVGFVYAFVVGYGFGRSSAALYNRFCP